MGDVNLYLFDFDQVSPDAVDFEFFNSDTYPVRWRNPTVGFEGVKPIINGGSGLMATVRVTMGNPPPSLLYEQEMLPSGNIRKGVKIGNDTRFPITKTIRLNVPIDHDIFLVIRMYRNDKQGGWVRCGDLAYSRDDLNVIRPIFCRDLLMRSAAIELMSDNNFQGFCKAICLGGAGPNGDRMIKMLEFVDEGKEHEMDHLKNGFKPSKCVKQPEEYQHCIPLHYCIPGITGPKTYSFSGQALFYWDPTRPAATEAWFLARLSEALDIRSMTRPTFVREAEAQTKESLKIAAHVLRMHSVSRPYVPDVSFMYGTAIHIDEDTMGLALPGDCEDNTMATYQIYMTLLFGKWKNRYVRALQKAAAILGIPCGISGTYTDPDEIHPEVDNGHWYLVAIPFCCFPVEFPPGKFEELFGFSVSDEHRRAAVLDTILITTFFYDREEENGSRTKKHQISDRIAKWIKDTDEPEWLFVHPLTNKHQAEGCAFRLFTDFLRHAGVSQTCSFFFESILTKENVREVYEANNNGPVNDSHVEGLYECATEGGIGIPIYLLTCEMNEPTYKLVPTRDFDKTEFLVRKAYCRPIVPLTVNFKDEFGRDVDDEYDRLEHNKAEGNPDTHVVVYCYKAHTLKTQLDELCEIVGNDNPKVYRYANGYAVVFNV